MNKIARIDPDAIYFEGIIENNAGQLIKDKVGAGMSNDDVLFIGPDGIFVDVHLPGRKRRRGRYITFGGLPESELTAKRASSSSRTTRASTTTRSSPIPLMLMRRPT